MRRLSSASLDQLPASTARPSYDRDQPVGVVHLGTGAFHRAHQATYFDALMSAGETGWMVQGASLRSATVAEQMNPQDGLYTVVVREGHSEHHQIIGSVKGVLVAREAPSDLVSAMAQESVSLVTMTVTEKGYCIDPATGTLRTDDPGIAADIGDIDTPQTAPGFLVAGLKARRAAGRPPFTVLSCDNLPDNGVRTRQAVLELAGHVDPALRDWIEAEGAFPSSMVDRIVPATTEGDIAALQASSGLVDLAMVKTEPFTQWVVEDWFAGRRPPLETVGVQMTSDVAAWEKAKLRLLNGAHSAIAYLGGLAGHEFVHEAMAAPGFAGFIDRLWDEAEATLEPIEGFDPKAYRAQLAARFNNAALRHRTHQIAMDGSQKLPQRLLNSIRDHRKAGRPVPPALTFAVAGWMRWQLGRTDAGEPYTIDDPLADRTVEAAKQGARGLLAMQDVFGTDLIQDEVFVERVEAAFNLLRDRRVSTCVEAFPNQSVCGGVMR